MSKTQVEVELDPHQRGLVETCFEEGQYDAGLKVLDQLRDPSAKPHAALIRQLLYLALYPPSPKQKETYDLEASPSKIIRQSKKSQPAILPSISKHAQRLLISFALTNSPSSVFRAIPRHTSSPATQPDRAEDGMESKVFFESLCISEAKDCWELLKPGFVRPFKLEAISERRTRKRDAFDSDEDDIESGELAVAKYVWPVLEWMIMVFEKNERWTQDEAKNIPRYSPLLLEQMPVPRGTHVQWDISSPLSVVFYCLEQTEERHIHLGYRLLTLLVNLTSTIYLDFSMFVTMVSQHMKMMPANEVTAHLSGLPSTPATLRFKISLYQSILVASQRPNTASKPIAKPKARARQTQTSKRTSTAALVEETDASSSPTTIASAHALPSFSDLLDALRATGVRPEEDRSLYKLHFLIVNGLFRSAGPNGNPRWSEFIASEEFRECVRENVQPKHCTILDHLVSTW